MKLSKYFPKQFLAQVAGAGTVAVIEAALEVYSPELFGQPTRISATNPPLGMEPLLPIEKWVILPVAGIIAGVTSMKRVKKAGMKAFGKGALEYAMPRLVSREIVRTQQASTRGWAPPA